MNPNPTTTAEIAATPARRRDLPSAPILIRVPVLATARVAPAPAPARRLRREVRIAASTLLALIPTALAGVELARRGGFGEWSGRVPALASALVADARVVDRGDALASAEGLHRRPAITLSLEPVASAGPARDFAPGPVFLSGQLLPADPSEESSHHGRH